MRYRQFRRVLAFAITAAGLVLLGLGVREYVDSRAGQIEAARDFQLTSTSPLPKLNLPGDTIARLAIPRLDSQLYVLEGSSEKQLRRGPGHLESSAPLGSSGNSVIAGHRDTHFRVLNKIRKGDDIVLRTAAGTFHYEVSKTSVVSPSDTESLEPTGYPVLHLVTCYPFSWVGPAPERFVVEARLTSGPER